MMHDSTKLIKPRYALKHMFVPLEDRGESVRIAIGRKPVKELISELQFILNKKVNYEIWDEAKILKEINARYHAETSQILLDDEPFELIDYSDEKADKNAVGATRDEFVIDYVNRMISNAIKKRSSDIHVELFEKEIRIRFRIDGKLQEQEHPPHANRYEVVSRLKIMAKMDIAEKRRPQDGRIRMKNSRNHEVDIRVSTLPSVYGEKVVLRILDKSSMKLSLDNLGFTDLNLQRLKRILRLPYGMILVTGPTGSGKTTTLYSALNYINSAEVNIITIEDPIEYQLPGINQTQVKPEIGLTFATILRTSLRQDPNIIMIGEIRDRETAEIAIRSAQTGHLVLSTLHTNNALGTVIRLLDMGIEPFLIANSLKLVISQRLVRRICPECKTRENINLKRIKLPIPESDLFKNEFYRGNGCQHCGHTGYTGRIAIDEQIEIDNDFSELILQKASLRTMQEEASHKGIEPLHVTAMGKALQGITSLNEVVAETVH